MSDKPGKLKFNAAMFNPAAMKPGAINPKLAAKKKAEAEKREEVKPLQNSDFDRPKRPRRARRINSRPTIDLDSETKEDDDKLSRSLISSDPIPEIKDDKPEPIDTNTNDNENNDNNETNNNENENDTNNEIKENNENNENTESTPIEESNENENENDGQPHSVLTPLSPNVKQLTNDLSTKFENRKGKAELEQKGLIDSKIASSLADTKHKLEQKQKAQQLQEKVNARPEPDEVVDQGYLTNDPRKLDGKLHESASTLSKNLEERADVYYLEHTNILKRPSMAHSLQPNAQNVEDKLTNRQPRDTMKSVIKTEFEATAQQVDRLKKEHNIKSSLNQRPEKQDLRQSNVLKSDAAPSIQGTVGQLDKAIKTDAVNKGIRERSTTEELSGQGIVKSTSMAPSLQSTSVTLERNIKTDHVSKDMKERSTPDKLASQNIVKNTNVAASLAGTSVTLERGMKTDNVSKGTRDRSTKEELQDKRVLKQGNMANSLQPNANELEHSLKSDRVSKNLKGQPTREEVTKQGALKQTDLAPSLQGAAYGLEQKMKGDKVKAQLSIRQDEDTLAKRGVLTPRGTKKVPAQFAGAAYDLDKSLKKDAVSKQMKERRTPEELEQSGILNSNQDVENLDRNDDFESYQQQQQAPDTKDNRLRTQKLLNRRLSKDMRPTPEMMAVWGIIPNNNYFEDPRAAVKARKHEKEEAVLRLARNYSQRSKPDELVARGLAYEHFWDNEAHSVERERKQKLQQARDQVAEKLNPKRRPSVIDLATHNIYPEDSEVVQELKQIALKHHRMASAVNDLANQLPFEPKVAQITAENMMKHLAETEEDVLLCDDTNCNNPQHGHGKRGSISNQLSSDESTDKVVQEERKQRIRRLSMSVEHKLKRRPTQDDLEDQGVIKHRNIAASLRGAAVELEELMGDRLPEYVLQHHKILKRPSIARSLQPRAEQLENEILSVLQRSKQDMDFEPIDENEHPLHRSRDSDLSIGSGNGRSRQRRASSAFGTLKGRNPTWYKHDIANSLQNTANKLHKQRLSITLNQKFASRPSKQELIDNRILYNAALAHNLQNKAFLLETILKMRVPENYLAKIGVLRHTGDSVAPSIQPTAADLENLLQRRPSLYEAMTNDMKLLLAEYEKNNYDNNINNSNNDIEMDAIKEHNSNSDNENDDSGFNARSRKAQRKQIGNVINRRLSLRMTREELIERGFLPEDYWEDPQHAYFMKGVNKKLFAEDLKRGIKNRSKPEEIYARGITRREWLEMDYEKAQNVVAKKIQYQRTNLKSKLHEHWGLGVVKELEDREILEPGYLQEAVDKVRSGHRRADSIVQEIQSALVKKPEYNEVIARGLVTDLQPETTEFEDESSEDDSLSDDDEEQHQRLLDLEYRIGHRPSMAELVDQRILHYHNIDDGTNKGIAPRIQGSAVGLQHALGRRKSIEDLTSLGLFTAEDFEQMGVSPDTINEENESEFNNIRNNNKSREERSANEYEMEKYNDSKNKPKKINKERKDEINKKLDRKRRPTMMDLELRGIVPEGYFKNVESALKKKSIRRNSVVNDLSSRLKDRPELSDLIARKIFDKALKASEKRDELLKKQTQKESIMVKALLEKKLAEGRPSVADLQSKNIVKNGYDPRTQHAQVNQRAVELENQSKRNKLETELNARQTQEQLLDAKYLRYKVGGDGQILAPVLHEVASELDTKLTHRIDENALKKDKILFENEISYQINEMDKKLDPKRRPDFNDMVGRGYIRQEYYDPNVEIDEQQKREREALGKIKLQLEGMIGSNKPNPYRDNVNQYGEPLNNNNNNNNNNQSNSDLINTPNEENNYETTRQEEFKMDDRLISDTQRIQQQHQSDVEHTGATPAPSRMPLTENEINRRNLHRDSIDNTYNNNNNNNPQISRNYSSQSAQSPEIPAINNNKFDDNRKIRSIADGHAKAAKERVMHQLNTQNRMVLEPLYQVDVLVAEPELKDNEIYSSQLAFMNVLDALERIIQIKMNEAQVGHINEMTKKASNLSTLKNLLRKLQAFGPSVIDTIDENPDFENIDFKSSGDFDKDIENVSKSVWNVQKELYDLDESYFPLHKKIRQLQNVKDDMNKYYDEYRMKLSQLKRIERRIQSYINENKTNKDSSQEAIKATSERQGLMLSKITNKIAETHLKIDRINYELSKLTGVSGIGNSARKTELTQELTTCKNFLTGLTEFKKGLKKLRTEQQSRIKHLEQVITQLIKQRAVVSDQLSEIRTDAINKLDEVRKLYIIPMTLEHENMINNNNNHNSNSNNNNNVIEKSSTLSQQSSDSSGMFGSMLDDDLDPDSEYDNLAPLSMMELMHKREKYMNKVFKKIGDLESRALTTSSSDYLRGLTEIRELQIILSNNKLKYFYNQFVNKCNQIFHDCVLASAALFEQSAEWEQPILQDMDGIKLLKDIIFKNNKFDERNHKKYLDTIQNFISSLPDKEVVIMQVGRHIATSLPFRSQILNENKEKYHTKMRHQRLYSKRGNTNNNNNNNNTNNDTNDENDGSSAIEIQEFVLTRIRELMASILDIYGNNRFNSVRVAVDNDVVAQVRPSRAAKIIVNCVYGLDVSL